MNALADLALVFAAVSMNALRSLQNALACKRVINGRFVDGRGNGCIFHWLSEREMVDRASRKHWTGSNWLFGLEQSNAMKRLIVGWDANNPEMVVKGPGYDNEYPAPSYVLAPEVLAAALAQAVKEREDLGEVASPEPVFTCV